ncbi:MAG: amphi-Trp domain-containing protein [Chloroflexota bacterium]|jgi:amphi-Trp domain-containing protein|nr:amphi-Trp domain-containing protein [Chloroflexota bacterium]
MAHHHSHRERGASGPAVRARASLGIEQAAGYMETLAQALRAGGVTVRSGGELVALRAAERVALELEAGEEGAHSVMRLDLRWETPVPEERLDIVPGIPGLEQLGASSSDAESVVDGPSFAP